MDSNFSELYASSSVTRKQYAGLFGIPHNFQFTKDTLLLEYEGSLYSTAASDFQFGSRNWTKISSAKPMLNTRNAQLLQERMRQSGMIKMSEVLRDGQTILLHGSPPQLQQLNGEVVSTFPNCEGGLGIQICPSNYQLVVCVLDGDLFLLHSLTGKIHQLTFTKDVPNLSAGFPPYVIQEEFDRYVGFLWNETDRDDCTSKVYKILYEEVNTEGLEVLHTFNPLLQSVEDYPYPRPGKMNAKSVLKLLEFSFHDVDGTLNVKELSLSVSLQKLFPHCCEYLVRFGWMPGEEAVWIQLLNRQQTHLMLVVVTTNSFGCEGFPHVYVLWEEKSSFWISVSDCLKFISVERSLVRFVWLSECSGHSHLYLVDAKPPEEQIYESSTVHYATHSSRVLTHGDWSILNSKIWINRESQLLYFQANKLSPVSSNLYCISLFEDGEPRQITTSGFYHSVTLDTMNYKYFLTVFSNSTSSINIAIHSLAEPYAKIAELCGPDIPSSYTAPTTFNVTSETGEELYGAIYPPENLKDGMKVPTILYVYGGPGVQLVTSALSRQLPRIQLWRKHGYAVVMLDNRGSANRGVHFASFVKGQMGLVEVRDQVFGLKEASAKVDFIDMSRVGIMGWSYGGYLALMTLCNYPDLIKVCVAGAPVTDWFDYDSAYTERYLGVPHDSSDDAYIKSSLLNKASNFPSESGRLLIIHGLDDENVFFTHSVKLCNELVSYGKPYTIQIYPGERHGLKSQNNVLHCDATILQFLNKNL